jgi:D-arabinose 1-dehydrogenase-like Zn-dependent alcohol dehydrogenase
MVVVGLPPPPRHANHHRQKYSTAAAAAAAAGTLNGIIDTVSAKHDVNALLALLAPRGRMVVVGLPPDMPTINHFAVVQKNLVYSGSTIGNLGMTQEMLHFCGEKNITADVEVGGHGLYVFGLLCPVLLRSNLAMTQEMLNFCGEKNITADVEVGCGASTSLRQLYWMLLLLPRRLCSSGRCVMCHPLVDKW